MITQRSTSSFFQNLFCSLSSSRALSLPCPHGRNENESRIRNRCSPARNAWRGLKHEENELRQVPWIRNALKAVLKCDHPSFRPLQRAGRINLHANHCPDACFLPSAGRQVSVAGGLRLNGKARGSGPGKGNVKSLVEASVATPISWL